MLNEDQIFNIIMRTHIAKTYEADRYAEAIDKELSSHICKNCKFLSTIDYTGRNSCIALGEIKIKLDFGCNIFKPKDL